MSVDCRDEMRFSVASKEKCSSVADVDVDVDVEDAALVGKGIRGRRERSLYAVGRCIR